MSQTQGELPVGSSNCTELPWGRPALLELLESLPDAVIGCDSRGHIVLWSAAARKAYGYSAREATGCRAATLLRTRFPSPALEIREHLIDVGNWEGRLVHCARDGREVAVQSRWVARYDDGGEFVGAFAAERAMPDAGTPELSAIAGRDAPLADSSELRQAERLESLGQLAGGVAHDFNNALAIIINYAAFVGAELARLHTAPTDEQRAAMREDLGEIQRAAERAAELTHQLLAFSRQEVGAPRELDLNAVIGEIERLLARTLGSGIDLQLHLAAHLGLVMADPSQLQQVLINLAINARDAMPQGGTLTIETDDVELPTRAVSSEDLATGRYVRLRVSDTGHGMTPEVMERAFDPFFTTKGRGRGTGLGLSSVYGIVTRAGGRARFFSAPGVGTTFVALLPDVTPPAGDAPPAAETQPSPPQVTGTILLVERDRPMREMVRRILAGAGHRVLVAADGEDAVALARSQGSELDLLLADIVMPGLLGYELAQRVRAVSAGVSVLYVSGFSESVLGAHAPHGPAGNGAEELIARPFAAPTLLHRVARALADRADHPVR